MARMSIRLCVASTLALCLLVSVPCEAATADLSGRVIDAAGTALPGVYVAAVHQSSNASATVTTGGDGTFQLALPPGTVTVTARLLGFATVVRENVLLEAPASKTADVTMLLEVTADIVVTAKSSFRSLAGLERGDDLFGIADSSSEGVVAGDEIDRRPVQRPGEILETIPGVVVSQHSGEGKANQYYLRGFNLDHGTDFAVSVAGVPVNMPSHGHGQGYADTNFLIPELVTAVQFKKGPYFAEEGDFSSAGAASINYANRLERPLLLLQGGSFGHKRALVAGSSSMFGGIVLGAVEAAGGDGPWTRPSDLRKANAVLRFTRGDHRGGWSVTAMGYDSRWNSTDQIPRRGVEQKLIDRFGVIDETDGGETHRFSLAGEWQRGSSESVTRASAYAIDYALDLYSNFTYFLDDPARGDQFQQVDDRLVSGASISHRWRSTLLSRDSENLIGGEFRHDDINEVGLHRTERRIRFATVRDDRVRQTSGALFAQNSTQWTPWARLDAGLRADFYDFEVESGTEANSGRADDMLVNPKLSLVLGPWLRTEIYLNAGQSFHSNDARGVTIAIDPVSGEPAQRVDPLVRSRGFEAGFRSRPLSTLVFTTTVWRLDLDSELLFVGDAGNTESTRPSRRSGVEVDATIRVGAFLIDAALAWSRARFADSDPAGSHIPGSVGSVASVGIALLERAGWSGEVRYRHLGARPLIEDGSVRSEDSHLVSARAFYALTSNIRLQLDVFNALDARVSDIDYFYRSRLQGEPTEGFDDIHTHPAEPRSVRAALAYTF